MSLRQELALDGAKHIHVCTVMPATIDTPLFQHAANYTGRAAKTMPPVYAADKVAKTVVKLAERPQREVFVGNSGRFMNLQQMLAPGMTERMFATMVQKEHLDQKRPAPPTAGNLFEPMPEWTSVSGGWKAPRNGASRALTIGLAALVPAALAWLWLRPSNSGMARALSIDGRRSTDLGRLLEPLEPAASALGLPAPRRRRFPFGL